MIFAKNLFEVCKFLKLALLALNLELEAIKCNPLGLYLVEPALGNGKQLRGENYVHNFIHLSLAC